MFNPQTLSGMVDVHTPEGRIASARVSINKDGRGNRDEREKASVTLEFFSDSDLSYRLIQLLLDGDLKAFNLDYVIANRNEPEAQNPPAGVGG